MRQCKHGESAQAPGCVRWRAEDRAGGALEARQPIQDRDAGELMPRLEPRRQENAYC